MAAAVRHCAAPLEVAGNGTSHGDNRSGCDRSNVHDDGEGSVNSADERAELELAQEEIVVPGGGGVGAPVPADDAEWANWLCATALPQAQPTRMPPQRFDYWSPLSAARVRALTDDAAASFGPVAGST